MQDEHTHSELDATLAAIIDRRNAGEDVESEDPLDELLQQYRSLAGYESSSASQDGQSGDGFEVKDDVWAAIDRKTSVRPIEAQPLRLIRPIRLAAIAAAVMVALTVTWLQLRSNEGAEQPLKFAAVDHDELHALPDGSSVLLRRNSSLEQRGDHSFELTGEAQFDVAHDPSRIFAVSSGESTIEVLGTSFNADTWSGGLRTYLIEGKIRLSAGSGEAILDAGQAAIAVGDTVERIDNTSVESFLDWQKGFVALSRTPLSEAVSELQHHFGVVISLPGSMTTQTISGALSLESLEASLSDLGLVLDGKFVQQNDGAYSFQSN